MCYRSLRACALQVYDGDQASPVRAGRHRRSRTQHGRHYSHSTTQRQPRGYPFLQAFATSLSPPSITRGAENTEVNWCPVSSSKSSTQSSLTVWRRLYRENAFMSYRKNALGVWDTFLVSILIICCFSSVIGKEQRVS